MIVFLTVSYIVILQLCFKFKVVKKTLWWKISPIVWVVLLTVCLFIPMQFWAPGGQLIVMQYSVPIVPNVGGTVVEVNIEPNQPLEKGEVLFKLDPTPFRAGRDQVAAQLDLARARLNEATELRKEDAVSIWEYEQYEATVKQLEAGLEGAQFKLDSTIVRAPSDGFVTNVGLRVGSKASQLPLAPSMAFVESSDRVFGAQILQSYLRYIEPGQPVEVTFKAFPGKIFTGEVEYVIMGSATGQLAPGGALVAPKNIQPVPFAVRVKLDEEELVKKMPAGAVGSVAIYTGEGAPTHVIRKVMIRMDAYMNYIDPR